MRFPLWTSHVAFAAWVVLAVCPPCAQAAVTISTGATSNMACSAGICAPTAKDAVLNVGDLENLLASGDVEVTTGSGGVQAKDIDVHAALSWSSSSGLTLDAHRSVTVEDPVSVNGLGGLSLTTNHGGSAGTLLFTKKGKVTFANLSSVLKINRADFTLVNNVKSLAAAVTANPAGDYALANDYDASQDGTYSNSPVATTLTGTLEGLGNTISNLAMVHTGKEFGYFGLFSINNGTVEHIRLARVSISIGRGTRNVGAAGALAGQSTGVLFDDEASGTVAGKTLAVGGLVGGNGGSISNSSAIVHTTSQMYAGGLVGENGDPITLSHADGAAKGRIAGGLVGDNDRASISQSYATGAVTGADDSIVGGLVGRNEGAGDINNSYATGTVAGGMDAEVGGFSGENDSTVEASYSTGSVTGETGSMVGGFTGNWAGENPFAFCYWNTTTSGTDQGTGTGNLDGITGLTTEQLQSGLPDGLVPSIWKEKSNINGGLPYLIANPPPK